MLKLYLGIPLKILFRDTIFFRKYKELPSLGIPFQNFSLRVRI
nr:MAG TPA: hypothetical protein [Caudoviricetes sp.]